MPISVIPTSRRFCTTYSSTGLFAMGTSCLGMEYPAGRSRVPAPPDSTRAFIDPPPRRNSSGEDETPAARWTEAGEPSEHEEGAQRTGPLLRDENYLSDIGMP